MLRLYPSFLDPVLRRVDVFVFVMYSGSNALLLLTEAGQEVAAFFKNPTLADELVAAVGSGKTLQYGT
eukprot:765436-Hanusia_phi.AAC.3